MLPKLMKLIHHDHSGKLRPHEHTSYASLVVLLALVGLALASFTVSAQSPGPQGGSIGISGVVLGEPPETAATIDNPANGDRFVTSPVTISGTCPPDTLVEVYKNDIFAGSTICSSEGVYSFDVDLLIGENILIARVYDALNQPGPDSTPVTIFYDALPPQPDGLNNLDFGGAQLLLNTDAVFRGAFPNETVQIPIDIIGGTPPFAVNVQWGDANNRVIPRNDNVGFSASHVYTRPGTYQVSLQATDSTGRVAFLTVAAIVNGQPSTLAGTAPSTNSTINQLLALWPFYTSAVAIVVSFWLGELREKRVLMKRGPVYKSPA